MTDSTITRHQLKAAFKNSVNFKHLWPTFKDILNKKGIEKCIKNVRYMIAQEFQEGYYNYLGDPLVCLIGPGVAKEEGTSDYYHVNEDMEFHGWAYDGSTFVLYYEGVDIMLHEESSDNLKKYLPFFDELRNPESSISKISDGVIFK